MFIVAQFPLSDLRSLALDNRGRLLVPDWNADEIGDVFVRGFGAMATRGRRMLGYVKDFLDIIVGKIFEASIRVMIKPEG